jgi:THAP4-like, heme-binding beta-barrel domain
MRARRVTDECDVVVVHTGIDTPARTLARVPDLHPGIAVLAPLLGTWSGPGAGAYPTITSFNYLESVTFGHVGKPFLAYAQRTKAADDGRPLHAESGYVRVPEAGRVEWLLAHPTGIVEVLEGTLTTEPLRMELTATTIGRSASAKEVTALARSFHLDGDELTYTVRMGAVGLPLQHHLSATLRRQS